MAGFLGLEAVPGSGNKCCWLLLGCHSWVRPLEGVGSLLCSDLCCVPCGSAQEERAYYQLRLERTNKKLVGVRAKRAAEAAADDKDKAK